MLTFNTFRFKVQNFDMYIFKVLVYKPRSCRMLQQLPAYKLNYKQKPEIRH